MKYEQGAELMLDALKGIHGKFKKLYGQCALRLNDNLYLLSGGNKLMSDIDEDSFVICNVDAGGLGEVFKLRPDIQAMLFGVTQDMVVVSDRDRPLDATLEDLAHLTGAKVRVAPDASTESIIEALGDSTLCLIKGMGGLATGSSLKSAVAGIQIIEKACEAELHGKLLGGTKPISVADAEQYRREFVDDYVCRNAEKTIPFVGYDEYEFTLRSKLIETGKNLVRKDLCYGSWGNLSVRLNEKEMLITPSAIDFFEIKPEDIVRMDINTLVYGDQRMPSGESPLHAALYRALPDCNAVIHTHSNAMSVFAACEAGFVISEPAVRELIGDVLVTRAAYSGTPELAVAVAETMSKTHAAIIPHHGAVFTGPDLDMTFIIAEAVELRGRNILGFDLKPTAEEA